MGISSCKDDPRDNKNLLINNEPFLRERIRNLKIKNNELKNEINESKNIINKLNEKIKQIENEKNIQKNTIEQLEEINNNFKNENNSLKQNINSLQKNNDEFLKNYNKKENEVDQLKAKNNELNNEKNSLLNQLNTFKNKENINKKDKILPKKENINNYNKLKNNNFIINSDNRYANFKNTGTQKSVFELKKKVLENQKQMRKESNTFIGVKCANKKLKINEVLEDMCIYGNIIKKEMEMPYFQNQKNYISSTEALKLENKDNGLFALGLLAQNLENSGIKTLIDKSQSKEGENEASTSLQFISNGLLQKKNMIYILILDKKEMENY